MFFTQEQSMLVYHQQHTKKEVHLMSKLFLTFSFLGFDLYQTAVLVLIRIDRPQRPNDLSGHDVSDRLQSRNRLLCQHLHVLSRHLRDKYSSININSFIGFDVTL